MNNPSSPSSSVFSGWVLPMSFSIKTEPAIFQSEVNHSTSAPEKNVESVWH